MKTLTEEERLRVEIAKALILMGPQNVTGPLYKAAERVIADFLTPQTEKTIDKYLE